MEVFQNTDHAQVKRTRNISDKSVRYIRSCIQIVFITFLGSCLTPIDRSSDYIGGQIVISGQISPIEETNIISIGRTASTERLPEPVLGALITLFDDEENEMYYIEDGSLPGNYTLNAQGSPGKTYHIRVTTPDGETYESIPEKMPETIGQDAIYYSLETRNLTDPEGTVNAFDFVNIYTNAALPSSASDPVYLKWDVEEVYLLSPTDFPDPFGAIPPPCFIRRQVDPQNIVLFNREELKTTTISGMQVGSRQVDRSFKERHYFTTYQSSLTREAYEYWRKINIVANQVGSIFDSPPARITGNIFNVNRQEEVLGYFQAVNQTYSRFFMLPSDFPFQMTEYCEYRNDRTYSTYPSECLDCLSARNSSHNRPPWF